MSVAAAVEFRGKPSLAEPDYLPARMINEYAYCPRLFHYEQVLGVFVHNEHTVEGAARHKRVDKEGKGAPKPGDKTEELVVVSSITLASDEHRVIAKLDLAEFKDGLAMPIDYKRGRPRKTDDGIKAWPSDEVQRGYPLLPSDSPARKGCVHGQSDRQRAANDQRCVGGRDKNEATAAPG